MVAVRITAPGMVRQRVYPPRSGGGKRERLDSGSAGGQRRACPVRRYVRSDAFPARPGEEQKINPGRWGAALVEHLKPELASRGFIPTATDRGYVIEPANPEFRLWIGCGNYEAYPEKRQPTKMRYLIRVASRCDMRAYYRHDVPRGRHFARTRPSLPGCGLGGPEHIALSDTNAPDATEEELDMLELRTCKDAETVAQTLQIFFFESPIRELSAHIPTDFLTRALELALYLLPYMKSGSEHYIRSKLNTRNPSLSEAVREAMTEGVSANSRWAVLEHHLRIVINVIRDAQTLNPTELQHVETLIGPLWEYRTANFPLQSRTRNLDHLRVRH